jgi:hypothetical protein
MNKNASSSISYVENLDANSLIKSIKDHLEPNQAKELLETALSKNDSKGYHGCTSSEVSHDQRFNRNFNLVETVVTECLMEKANAEDSPLESPN